jgi:glutaconate CoA-transferase subunit A
MKEGNVQAWGVLADHRDGAFASKRVTVSVEEIVPNEVVRSLPNMTVLPFSSMPSSKSLSGLIHQRRKVTMIETTSSFSNMSN